jgi:phenol 2-monooxygenase
MIINSIKQSLAEKFYSKSCVLLVGEAGHTHSSAAAQGMNVGIHDVVNLAWKLGGVVRGYYIDDVLHTYETERRPAAETLLRLDKTFSTLISGKIPKDLANSAIVDPNQLLHSTFLASIEFNIGLGIHYDPSIINVAPTTTMITPGHRAPDTLLHPPGARIPVHLFQLTKNTGSFWVIVLAGFPTHTSTGIHAFRKYIDDTSASFAHRFHPDTFRLLTIIAGSANQAEEALGVPAFGNAYYDLDNSTHEKYGISPQAGAVVILRPDGIFGFATTLDRGQEVGDYFSGFAAKTVVSDGSGTTAVT